MEASYFATARWTPYFADDQGQSIFCRFCQILNLYETVWNSIQLNSSKVVAAFAEFGNHSMGLVFYLDLTVLLLLQLLHWNTAHRKMHGVVNQLYM